MTIIEALKSGWHINRKDSPKLDGFVSPGFLVRHGGLEIEDILADDWITNGPKPDPIVELAKKVDEIAKDVKRIKDETLIIHRTSGK